MLVVVMCVSCDAAEASKGLLVGADKVQITELPSGWTVGAMPPKGEPTHRFLVWGTCPACRGI